jgi:hypothetical protein
MAAVRDGRSRAVARFTSGVRREMLQRYRRLAYAEYVGPDFFDNILPQVAAGSRR